MKTKEIRVPAGKKTWIPLEVRIPMGALPGTHALRAIAASRTYPDLRRQCIIDVNIAQPNNMARLSLLGGDPSGAYMGNPG